MHFVNFTYTYVSNIEENVLFKLKRLHMSQGFQKIFEHTVPVKGIKGQLTVSTPNSIFNVFQVNPFLSFKFRDTWKFFPES